jgi:predicted nucleotidyltransferase
MLFRSLDSMQPRIALEPAPLASLCRRWRIERLALFGSVVRGDFRPDSDVDILVEFEPGATPGLFAMEELRAELSVLAAGRDVDLVTPAALHPLLRERVLAQAVEQYAA